MRAGGTMVDADGASGHASLSFCVETRERVARPGVASCGWAAFRSKYGVLRTRCSVVSGR